MGDTRAERGGAAQATDQTAQADAAPEPSGTTFTSHGAIPPVVSFPGGSNDRASASPSDLAFGPGPAANKSDLQARADRMEIERLLKSTAVMSGDDAIAALDMLIGLPDAERTKVIGQLDERSFENLLDRLTDGQRARFGTLIDSAEDPKRRLKLWAAQHDARAHVDLQRYEGDFGSEDEQTTKQEHAQAAYERRKKGVESTETEVTAESAKLLAKGDKLTIADVDAMRARKDRELGVEMKHNINLTAESAPRADGSAVQWSEDEIGAVDASLDKLPASQADGPKSVDTYTRKANRGDPLVDSKGGEYHGNNSIDIYDNAHAQSPDRPASTKGVEYSVTHEVGHDVAHDHDATFRKFEKAAGWQSGDDKALAKQGITDDDLDGAGVGVETHGKHIKRDAHGTYQEVDATALPSKDETGDDQWKYAANNAQEHFAELYAIAVEAPDVLYRDYITHPAARVAELTALVREQQQTLASTPAGKQHDDLAAMLAENRSALQVAQKAVVQRRAIFDIIRNDVFGADKNTRDAAERLKKRGASADQIQQFEQKAAGVSTPNQVAAVERETMP